jgi:hypothetical protein
VGGSKVGKEFPHIQQHVLYTCFDLFAGVLPQQTLKISQCSRLRLGEDEGEDALKSRWKSSKFEL